MRSYLPGFLLVAVMALLVDLGPARAASTPRSTFICPTAKVGDSAPSCSPKQSCDIPTKGTDLVRTIVAGKQVWEPYSTLAVTSSVVDCAGSGTWSNLGALGIPLFSATIPVTPPPVTPPVVPPVTPPPVSCPNTFVNVQYTCSVANGIATCVGPVPP